MALQEKGNFGISKEMLEFFYTGKINLDTFLHGVESMKEPWGFHMEKIIAEWVKDRPGSRPWAWWEFSSPNHPQTFKPLNLDEVKMVTMDYIIWGVTHFPGPETFPEPPYLFESEAAYLRRKKLLMKGELNRINQSNFEPKEVYPFYVHDRFGQYSRVDDYQAILDKSKERYENGGSLDIKTFGLPESNYRDRFHIYLNECKHNYYTNAGSSFQISEERKKQSRVIFRNSNVKKYKEDLQKNKRIY